LKSSHSNDQSCTPCTGRNKQAFTRASCDDRMSERQVIDFSAD
jgi:hypothetical protein